MFLPAAHKSRPVLSMCMVAGLLTRHRCSVSFSIQRRATVACCYHPFDSRNVVVCGTQRLIGLRRVNRSDQIQDMNEMSSNIAAGARSFLKVGYLYLAAYIVLLSGDHPVVTEWETTASFIVGCYTSILCGCVELITVTTNAKTTHQCWTSQGGVGLGLNVAIRGCFVIGPVVRLPWGFLLSSI